MNKNTLKTNLSESENTEQMLRRVIEANKKLSNALCLIDSARSDLEYVFDNTDWDDMIMCDIDESAMKLGFVIGAFNLWPDEIREMKEKGHK